MDYLSIFLGTPQISFGLSDWEWFLIFMVIVAAVVIFIIVKFVQKKLAQRNEEQVANEDVDD